MPLIVTRTGVSPVDGISPRLVRVYTRILLCVSGASIHVSSHTTFQARRHGPSFALPAPRHPQRHANPDQVGGRRHPVRGLAHGAPDIDHRDEPGLLRPWNHA